MPKNNILIEQMKRVKKNIIKLHPKSMQESIALYRKNGWRYKRINDLFMERNRF